MNEILIISLITSSVVFLLLFIIFFAKNIKHTFLMNQLGEKELFLQQQFVEKEKIFINQIEGLKNEIFDYKSLLDQKNQALSLGSNEIISLKKDKSSLEEKLFLQKSDIENLNEKFSKEFENLAHKILDKNSETLTERNKKNLETVLNPLKEKIYLFENRIDQTHKESLQKNAELKTEIAHLSKLNEKITTEAKNLTQALKGENKTQGSWGEFILESILEKSGLAKDREYFIQQQYANEEGKKFQPDVIVQLPDNKQIIIDSKVSLIDYEKYYHTEDLLEKELHLKNHIQSIKNHINSLTSKEYQKLQGIQSLDFVILFSPIEGALHMVFSKDNQLFNYGFERNIILASPSNLIAMLKTISSVWKREYQNKNVIEIAKQAGLLYDKFVGVLDDFEKMGKQLNTVQSTYKDSMRKLAIGDGNLIKRVENIKKLGVNSSKQIEQKWLEKSEFDSNEEETI